MSYSPTQFLAQMSGRSREGKVNQAVEGVCDHGDLVAKQWTTDRATAGYYATILRAEQRRIATVTPST